jgi:phosphatidylglycerophosphate synthase
MIKFDLIVNNYIVKHSLYLFKNIHPNTITFTGMLLNFIIFFLYFSKFSLSKIIISILLFLRILADNLDGMVARKYNKTSKIGGLLDTISDNILSIMIVYCITFYFIPLLAFYFSLFFGLIMILYLFYYDALSLHSNFLESNTDGLINKIPVFLGYNTYIICISIIILLWLS